MAYREPGRGPVRRQPSWSSLQGMNVLPIAIGVAVLVLIVAIILANTAG